jgi:hypothetical protein
MYEYDEADNRTNRILAPYDYIRAFYDTSYIPAIELLQGFEQRTGIKLNVTDYDYEKRRCRTIEPELPDEIVKAMDAESGIPYKEKKDRVYFSTGETYSEYKARKYREEYLHDILNSRIDEAHPAYEAVEYLHSKRVQKWTTKQMDKVSEDMLVAINAIPNEETLGYAKRVYNAMNQYAYIPYRPVERTKRIYSVNSNALALPREIRPIFYRGCWSLDLKAAQFCIVGKLWDLPEIQQFFADGGNIWKELSGYLGIDISRKQEIKDFIYPLFYGAAKTSTLPDMAIKNWGDTKLMDHPFISQLLQAREQQKKLIAENEGAYDAFGEFVPVAKEFRERSSGNCYFKALEHNRRSVLCAVVQSWEVKIMLEIFEYIKSNKDLLLVGWLHDGIYVCVSNHKERSEKYINLLCHKATAVGNSLGINIQLESEFLSY